MAKFLILHFPEEVEMRLPLTADQFLFDVEWSSNDTGVVIVREGEDKTVRAVVPLPGPILIEVAEGDGES